MQKLGSVWSKSHQGFRVLISFSMDPKPSRVDLEFRVLGFRDSGFRVSGSRV